MLRLPCSFYFLNFDIIGVSACLIRRVAIRRQEVALAASSSRNVCTAIHKYIYNSTSAAGSILKFHLPLHLCLARLSRSLELLFHMIGERRFRVPDQGGRRKISSCYRCWLLLQYCALHNMHIDERGVFSCVCSCLSSVLR